jgi:hypothetical protein
VSLLVGGASHMPIRLVLKETHNKKHPKADDHQFWGVF